MGKLTKGLFLGVASAVGAYYYKNPKELEKHKELLKENVKLGLNKVNDFINGDCCCKRDGVDRTGEDIAKERLDKLTAAYNKEEKAEPFVELKTDEKPIEQVEIVEEEPLTETAEDLKEEIEKSEEVDEVVSEETSEDLQEDTTIEEVIGDEQEETSKLEQEVEDAKIELGRLIEERSQEKTEDKDVTEDKAANKTTLDSIVSLFSSKEDK
ncbi:MULTISPECIES: hypothetical protein [Gemella]|uniref:hypothetical protein n=1 Tax=Gemella TaxID=1378 RepID=UPI00076801B9|nr:MULTISPECIES: hypothetical protein [Gemella]AME08912.1 hypothetical protein AXE85_01245 [Gemella sp. oral taxon 928]AXI26485.1 hypothetical protein CG018_03020 [Gemella sp. ND 6198]